jgi:para-nitrobenzyl esterase
VFALIKHYYHMRMPQKCMHGLVLVMCSVINVVCGLARLLRRSIHNQIEETSLKLSALSIPANLFTLGFIALLVSACAAPKAAPKSVSIAQPQFETKQAVYLGHNLGDASKSGVHAFLGIPFAQAPVGELRWAAPQALEAPQAIPVVKAAEFAPACMQGPHLANWYKNVIESFGGDAESFPTPQFSEDCLYLNIWRPEPKEAESLPVFVFIHGGSNKGGWSYEPNYIGENLARQGAIVVTIAYRVGAFGFFSHPQLSQANFGLLDQIAALNWIKHNIAAVGGDPDNVTVAGESSGASNIAYLMASPAAQGLFQRAIHQSAGWAMYGTESKAEQDPLGEALALSLNGSGDSSIAALRSVGAQRTLEAAALNYQGHFFDPVIDGNSVVKPLAESAELGELADVDLMIGSNANESRMYLPPGATLKSWIAENLHNGGNAVNEDSIISKLKVAPQREDDLALARLDQLATSVNYTCPSFMLAQANAKIGGKTWFYYFTKQRDGELGAKMGAYHGAELPYVFDTHDDWLPTSDDDHSITGSVMQYWLNFAESGNPNSKTLRAWQRFEKIEDQVQYLGQQVKSAAHPSADLCQFLEEQN